MSASDQPIVLPQDVPFDIVTGEVTRDGAFILAKEGTDSLHIGWWSEEMKAWTCEINEARFDVGNLTPVAKIVCR